MQQPEEKPVYQHRTPEQLMQDFESQLKTSGVVSSDAEGKETFKCEIPRQNEIEFLRLFDTMSKTQKNASSLMTAMRIVLARRREDTRSTFVSEGRTHDAIVLSLGVKNLSDIPEDIVAKDYALLLGFITSHPEDCKSFLTKKEYFRYIIALNKYSETPKENNVQVFNTQRLIELGVADISKTPSFFSDLKTCLLEMKNSDLSSWYDTVGSTFNRKAKKTEQQKYEIMLGLILVAYQNNPTLTDLKTTFPVAFNASILEQYQLIKKAIAYIQNKEGFPEDLMKKCALAREAAFIALMRQRYNEIYPQCNMLEKYLSDAYNSNYLSSLFALNKAPDYYPVDEVNTASSSVDHVPSTP